MTLKQIKFNPFKHWENISNLYKQSFTKEERTPFFGLGSYEPDRATNSIRLSGYL